MVLKVYGYPASTCTRTVLVTLKEKNVPYEFHQVNMPKGEHKTPDYLKFQPFGQVPYINDDGFILYESRAIARYITAKYASQGTPLLPTDPKELAKFEQAASVEVSDFNLHATQIVYERIFRAVFNAGPTDESVVTKHVNALEKNLDVYESILGKQKYLAGDKLTLADLFHLAYGSYLADAKVDVLENTKRPNLSRWWKEISSRPSWKAATTAA